jgi:serine/threonine-protein kinase
VHEFGICEDNRILFGAFELLEGVDLAALLGRDGPAPIPLCVDRIMEAIAGLAEAHVSGIVHRDIKPANLFLADASATTATVKVLDLGLAKALHGRELDRGVLTTTSTSMGTPAYMAPEQLRSSKDVDARADFWSLGVVLYEMLTGALPFEGATVGAFLGAVMEGAPRPPRLLRPDLPEPLEAAILRCLRRDRSGRFASTNELARALLPFGSPAAAEIVREIQRHSDDDTAQHESDRWLAKTEPALPPTFETEPEARAKSRTRRKSSKGKTISLAVIVVALAFGIGFVVSQLAR